MNETSIPGMMGKRIDVVVLRRGVVKVYLVVSWMREGTLTLMMEVLSNGTPHWSGHHHPIQLVPSPFIIIGFDAYRDFILHFSWLCAPVTQFDSTEPEMVGLLVSPVRPKLYAEWAQPSWYSLPLMQCHNGTYRSTEQIMCFKSSLKLSFMMTDSLSLVNTEKDGGAICSLLTPALWLKGETTPFLTNFPVSRLFISRSHRQSCGNWTRCGSSAFKMTAPRSCCVSFIYWGWWWSHCSSMSCGKGTKSGRDSRL